MEYREKWKTMLQEITWQQFLLAAATLTAIWYIAVILLFFRAEIRQLFARKQKQQHAEPETAEPSDDQTPNLMGNPEMSEGMDAVDPEDLTFAPRHHADSKTQSLGIVSDFLQEIKELVDVLDREKGNKEDFHCMFGMLKEKYPTIRESGRLKTLASYLEDHLPFTLTDEEKQHLWD